MATYKNYMRRNHKGGIRMLNVLGWLLMFLLLGCGSSEHSDPSSSNFALTGMIEHIGTSTSYDSDGYDLAVYRPAESREGDLLILALHRTDDYLPLYVDGWTRIAECYKRNNNYDCSTEADCISWYNEYFCSDFGGHYGHDLAQAIFHRTVQANEPEWYWFDLNPYYLGHPGWAVLTALRGADNDNPLRHWAHTGCDGIADSLFPSVYGRKDDMVLLSMSFDDAVAQDRFRAPDGTNTLGYVSRSDEAGFLYGGTLTSTGWTGTMKTHGDGGPSCKDALISLTIKPKRILCF